MRLLVIDSVFSVHGEYTIYDTTYTLVKSLMYWAECSMESTGFVDC